MDNIWWAMRQIDDVDPTAFYAHLDICEQCRKHPMNLCTIGATLIRESIGSTAEPNNGQ